MALLKAKIPTISTLKIKLDTSKRIIELRGQKYKVTKDVSNVMEILITEINVLTSLFETVTHSSQIGES